MTLSNATVRDVLNAVCRSHGTLSWSVHPSSESRGRWSYTIQLDSYDGWGVSTSFALPPR